MTQRIDEWGIFTVSMAVRRDNERRNVLLQGAGWLLLLAPFSSSPMDLLISSPRFRTLTAMYSQSGIRLGNGDPFSSLDYCPYWSLDLLYGFSLFVCSTTSNSADLSTGLFWQR